MSDMYEPDPDDAYEDPADIARAEEPPDGYYDVEPVDLDEVKALLDRYENAGLADDHLQAERELLKWGVPKMIDEIEDLRAQVARWHALERAQQYAVTPAEQEPDKPGLIWLFDTPAAAYAYADGEESGPDARVWVRPVAYHPWTELVTESPF